MDFEKKYRGVSAWFGEQVIDIDWDIKSNSDFHKNIKKSIEELVNVKKDFFLKLYHCGSKV
jgi:hypothetical protein